MTERVLLTGATGFLGAHTMLALLRAGFAVRATARDVPRARARFAAFAPAGAQLEVVALDLERDDGWAEAATGCTYIIHTASPVPTGAVKNPDDVIGPARDGTLRVLRAARAAKIRRVVLTSSTAAVIWGHPRDGSTTYDEATWTALGSDISPYVQSKTLAERAAWDYVAMLPSAERFELVTLLPGALLGPLVDDDYSVSGEIVRALLARAFPGVPNVGFALLDVRDAADLHVAAMTVAAAANQRFILAGAHLWMVDIAGVLARHFGPRGFRVPTRRLPNFVLKTLALWNATAALTAGELGKRQDVSAARAKAVFGWQPRPDEEMILAMAESMIARGIVS